MNPGNMEFAGNPKSLVTTKSGATQFGFDSTGFPAPTLLQKSQQASQLTRQRGDRGLDDETSAETGNWGH